MVLLTFNLTNNLLVITQHSYTGEGSIKWEGSPGNQMINQLYISYDPHNYATTRPC